MQTPRLICPFCRMGSISVQSTAWICDACKRKGRAWRGIPDLRTQDDDYLPNALDWRIVDQLESVYNQSTLEALLEHYFDLAPEPIDSVSRSLQLAHMQTVADRTPQCLKAIEPFPKPGAVLDLGCGSGSSFETVSQHPGVKSVWGVDIAMRWLVIARKRLENLGLAQEVQLVCGCAEALPLPDRSFIAVLAGDVIEHVGDQAKTLVEVHRLLVPGGGLFLASPNRYSFAPEPHVHVWGVGFLPRSWMSAYVKRVRGMGYRSIKNLGLGEWRRLLRQSPFEGGTITAPSLTEGEIGRFGLWKRMTARMYQMCATTSPLDWVVLRVAPFFHVVARRSSEARATPSQPIRRETMRALVRQPTVVRRSISTR